MLSTNNLFLLYLSIELQSLAFYILPALRRYSNFSIEASLKYYIYSSFVTAVFLMGLSYIYYFFGTLNLSELQILLLYHFVDDTIIYF